MTTITTLPLRSEIPVEQTWDLASVYATPADWDAACAELTAQLPQLAAFRGRLAEGPATLLAFLEPMQAAGVLLGKITIYASNGASVDTGDQAAAARAGQARTLMANYAAAVAFFDPELVAIGLDQIGTWIAETPDLAFFGHYVDRLRQRERHVRSGEVEEVLALTGDPFAGPMSIYGMLNNADMTLPAGRGLGRHAAGGGAGQHRRAGDAPRPRRAAQRLGELRRRLPGLQEHPRRHVHHGRQAERLQRPRARPRLVAARLAGAQLSSRWRCSTT